MRPQALVKTGHTISRPSLLEATCVRTPDLNEHTTKTLFRWAVEELGISAAETAEVESYLRKGYGFEIGVVH